MISHLLDRQNGERALIFQSEPEHGYIEVYQNDKEGGPGTDEDTQVIINDEDVIMLIGFLQSYLECRTKQNKLSK